MKVPAVTIKQEMDVEEEKQGTEGDEKKDEEKSGNDDKADKVSNIHLLL